MSFYQPERITDDTFVEYVEYHDQLESTNTLAVELRDELRLRSPALVLTDQQTSGRGRGSPCVVVNSGRVDLFVSTGR